MTRAFYFATLLKLILIKVIVMNRFLAIIVFYIAVNVMDIIGVLFGWKPNAPEFNLITAFVIAWCNEDKL